jgi:hypothetical protein
MHLIETLLWAVPSLVGCCSYWALTQVDICGIVTST